MLNKFRQQVGTAGLAVAVIALVFAMLGGAYAASSGSGDRATASAKKGKPGPRGKRGKQGKPGSTGPAGPQGLPGPAGPVGPAGAAGSAGANGKDGQGVTSEEFGLVGKDGKCIGAGGTKITSASGSTYTCNGKEGGVGPQGDPGPEGSAWTLGGVVPDGKTLTGVWTAANELNPEFLPGHPAAPQGGSFYPINFTIPLAAADADLVQFVAVKPGDTLPKEGCGGVEDGTPTADPGKLCLYLNLGNGAAFLSFSTLNPSGGSLEGQGVAPSGTIVKVTCAEIPEAPPGFPCPASYGTWAVTAPVTP